MNKTLICPSFEKAIGLSVANRSTAFLHHKSSIGISGKVLSDRLQDLENEGIVKREVFRETPV